MEKKLETALLLTRCVFLKFLFWISVVKGDEKHTYKSSFRSALFVKAPLNTLYFAIQSLQVIYGDFLPYGSNLHNCSIVFEGALYMYVHWLQL